MKLTDKEQEEILESHIVKQTFMIKITDSDINGLMISTADVEALTNLRGSGNVELLHPGQLKYETAVFEVNQGDMGHILHQHRADKLETALLAHTDYILKYVEEGYQVKDMA